jgi:hypothetical protein
MRASDVSVYGLGLLNGFMQTRVYGHQRTIEQQVARAAHRLSGAGPAVSRLRAQRAEASAIRDLTKSTTSAVT